MTCEYRAYGTRKPYEPAPCRPVAGDSLLLLSASADPSVRLWQVETGRELYKWPHRGPVRSVVWAEGEREFVTCSDPFGMTVPAAISVFTFADEMSAQVR